MSSYFSSMFKSKASTPSTTGTPASTASTTKNPNAKSSKKALIKYIIQSNKAFSSCKINNLTSITDNILSNSTLSTSDKKYALENIIASIFNNGVNQYENILNKIIDNYLTPKSSGSLTISQSSLLISIIDKANLFNETAILDNIKNKFKNNPDIIDYLNNTKSQSTSKSKSNNSSINAQKSSISSNNNNSSSISSNLTNNSINTINSHSISSNLTNNSINTINSSSISSNLTNNSINTINNQINNKNMSFDDLIKKYDSDIFNNLTMDQKNEIINILSSKLYNYPSTNSTILAIKKSRYNMFIDQKFTPYNTKSSKKYKDFGIEIKKTNNISKLENYKTNIDTNKNLYKTQKNILIKEINDKKKELNNTPVNITSQIPGVLTPTSTTIKDNYLKEIKNAQNLNKLNNIINKIGNNTSLLKSDKNYLITTINNKKSSKLNENLNLIIDQPPVQETIESSNNPPNKPIKNKYFNEIKRNAQNFSKLNSLMININKDQTLIQSNKNNLKNEINVKKSNLLKNKILVPPPPVQETTATINNNYRKLPESNHSYNP